MEIPNIICLHWHLHHAILLQNISLQKQIFQLKRLKANADKDAFGVKNSLWHIVHVLFSTILKLHFHFCLTFQNRVMFNIHLNQYQKYTICIICTAYIYLSAIHGIRPQYIYIICIHFYLNLFLTHVRERSSCNIKIKCNDTEILRYQF